MRTQKAILSVGGILACLFIALLFGPLYLAFDEPWASLAFIAYGIVGLINLALYGFWHKNHLLCVFVLAVFALPAHWLATFSLGGFTLSYGIMLWGLAFPVIGSLIFFGPRTSLLWFTAFFAGVLFSIFLQPWLRATNNIPPLAGQALLALTVLAVTILALASMMYFIQQREEALRLLRKEQEKSERLLLNVLPAEIAPILKDSYQIIADRFDEVSILFADVVGFTPLSAEMSPEGMVLLLNDVFSFFDKLVAKYDVEKIRTIGDSYMVVAGAPRPHPDHAQRLARMALEMIAYLHDPTRLAKEQLEFRIGINSGSVVAGVIGQTKFQYDVWGDAVNTASRMESHGLAGKIQIGRSTYELLKDEFQCVSRGKIEVKGKGEMETWFLEGISTPNNR